MAAVTLKEKAYLEVRRLILGGELKPGEFLTERLLVEKLGMSRTPIRSALERLDVEGLAKYTPNKGLIVAEISLRKANDIYDYRLPLECHVVRRLASHTLSEQDLQAFQSNLALQRVCMEKLDYAGFTQVDAEFHRLLAKQYNNIEIVQAIEQLQDKLVLIALHVLQKDRSRIHVSYEDHSQIFEAIVQGNGEAAAVAMERHLEYGKRILLL